MSEESICVRTFFRRRNLKKYHEMLLSQTTPFITIDDGILINYYVQHKIQMSKENKSAQLKKINMKRAKR